MELRQNISQEIKDVYSTNFCRRVVMALSQSLVRDATTILSNFCKCAITGSNSCRTRVSKLTTIRLR